MRRAHEEPYKFDLFARYNRNLNACPSGQVHFIFTHIIAHAQYVLDYAYWKNPIVYDAIGLCKQFLIRITTGALTKHIS
jgi:hypothetical protein